MAEITRIELVMFTRQVIILPLNYTSKSQFIYRRVHRVRLVGGERAESNCRCFFHKEECCLYTTDTICYFRSFVIRTRIELVLAP